MKRISDKVQRLGQRAAQVRQTIESLPPKLTHMRSAVANTTLEVQKLRSEIMTSVGTLRAENDDQLIAALREIDGGKETLAAAGCSVGTVDLDLGPTRKLVVRLWRSGRVSGPALRGLLEANADKPALKSLLIALQKADELTARVDLQHLVHNRLTVEIGLVPSVRIGWGDDEFPGSELTTEPSVVPAAPSQPSEPAAVGVKAPAPSFFEPRPASPATTPPGIVTTHAPDAMVSPVVAVPAAADAAPAPRAARWSASALDRFKKMPPV